MDPDRDTVRRTSLTCIRVGKHEGQDLGYNWTGYERQTGKYIDETRYLYRLEYIENTRIPMLMLSSTVFEKTRICYMRLICYIYF